MTLHYVVSLPPPNITFTLPLPLEVITTVHIRVMVIPLPLVFPQNQGFGGIHGTDKYEFGPQQSSEA